MISVNKIICLSKKKKIHTLDDIRPLWSCFLFHRLLRNISVSWQGRKSSSSNTYHTNLKNSKQEAGFSRWWPADGLVTDGRMKEMEVKKRRWGEGVELSGSREGCAGSRRQKAIVAV